MEETNDTLRLTRNKRRDKGRERRRRRAKSERRPRIIGLDVLEIVPSSLNANSSRPVGNASCGALASLRAVCAWLLNRARAAGQKSISLFKPENAFRGEGNTFPARARACAVTCVRDVLLRYLARRPTPGAAHVSNRVGPQHPETLPNTVDGYTSDLADLFSLLALPVCMADGIDRTAIPEASPGLSARWCPARWLCPFTYPTSLDKLTETKQGYPELLANRSATSRRTNAKIPETFPEDAIVTVLFRGACTTAGPRRQSRLNRYEATPPSSLPSLPPPPLL